MRKIFATAFLLAIAIFCNAQSWELKVNAGGNTTLVDNIKGKIFYGKTNGKFPWEELNSNNFIGQISTDQTSTLNKIGFYADGELVRHLGRNWSLSVSAGINKTNYSYDIAFPTSSRIDTTSMKDIDNDFGNTKLLYVSSRLLNVTKSFSNLSLTAGPVLNFLVSDNDRGKIYYHDNGDNTVSYIASPLYKPNKFLFGGNLALGYKLAKPLELKAGTQYFFNSVYKKGENKNIEGKDVKVNPFQINLGLSYSLMKF